MFEIIPSPGTQDKEWDAVEKKLEIVKPFAKTVHIDVCDGKFADNTTFLDPEPFKKYASVFDLEVHLMVDDPITYLDKWAAAGFKRFIGQIERMPNQVDFVAKAQQLGEVGLAIDGPTAVENLKVSPLDLDVLLIMLIKAGFSGQEMQEEYINKITHFSKDELLSIAVDGGINESNIDKAYLAGARRFAVTSAIFNSQEPEVVFNNLNSKLNNLLG